MDNYVNEGKRLELAHTSAVLSGEPVKIGSKLGVALQNYEANVEGVYLMEGVFRLPVRAADVLAVGEPLYWDDANKYLTKTPSSHILAGFAVEAKPATITEVKVKL